jgi:CubicO group peptidase (beta-lactamase class C family)
VDADTLFQIGSTSKAFTTADIAILVEEGKIGWDDRVIDHLPWFRMYDAWVTREITIRDLLTHRAGLGEGQGDLLFVPFNNLGRADSVRRLRFLKPATSFRSTFAYDNVLYMVAGQLIEEVTGETWEKFTESRIFKPIGMATSVTNDVDRLAASNRALPHGRLGELRGVGAQQLLTSSAQGWARIAVRQAQLRRARTISHAGCSCSSRPARSRTRTSAFFSAASSAEMWQPVVPEPTPQLPPSLADATAQFRGYALGWGVHDYRGHKVYSHGGGTQGFRTAVVLIPEKKVGFAIVNNSEDNEFVPGLEYELLDHYLGLPKHDWPKAFKELFDQRNAAGLEAQRAASASRPESKPSLPAAGYAGHYSDPWYGPIDVVESNGQLSIDFRQTPGMVAPLEHWAYDTFVARWPDPLIEPAYVTFALDAAGKPSRITMKAYSPVADFSFDYHDLEITPVAPAAAPAAD